MSVTLAPDTNREQWLAARRKGIGASEIAAVLGISPWESPFSLYWRKVNGWDYYEPSAEMEWGNRLEDAIAAKYADAHRDEILLRGALTIGPEPWMLATPDRLIAVEPPEEVRCWRYPDGVDPLPTVCGVLELKTARTADGWGDDPLDVPVHYRAQCLWQMLCVEVSYAVLAVLIGGSDYREYLVRADDRDIAVMVEHGRRFMARIEAGDPPPLDDHHATLATVKRLHPDLDDVEAEVDSRIANGYLRACKALKLAERVRDRYEVQLRAQMGRAKRATTGGRKVATRTVSDIAGSTVIRAPYRKDYLTPAREKR